MQVPTEGDVLPIPDVNPSIVLQIPSQSTNARKSNARTLREQRLINYFCGSQTTNIGDFLLSLPQYRLSFSSIQCYIGHARGHFFHVALNGSLVGLSIDPSFIEAPASGDNSKEHDKNGERYGMDKSRTIQRAQFRPRLLQRIPVLKNAGMGIVQAIDMNRKEVIVITPLSAEEMRGVNTLILSSMPIPHTMMVNV